MSWYGCAVPCHAIKQARSLSEDIATRYPEAVSAGLIKVYTSESDNKVKRADFKDATGAWGTVLCAIYTGTVSVGVSAETKHISNVFAFFDGRLVGSGQSCQQLFRAREVTEIDIAYTGSPDRSYPQTPKALFEWATLANNRKNIPDLYRGDCCPSTKKLYGATQEDPEALQRAVMDTFVGGLWVAAMMERYRSLRWFPERVARTLEDSGCTVEVAEIGGVGAKSTLFVKAAAVAAAVADVDCSEGCSEGTAEQLVEELRAVNHHAAVATEAADTRRATMAAEGFPKELRQCVQAEDDGVAYKDAVLAMPDPDEVEIQGRRALFAAKCLERSGGLTEEQLDELAALPVDARARWVRWHAAPSHESAFTNLAKVTTGATTGLVRSGGVQIATTSDREAGRLVRLAFDAIGVRAQLDSGGVANIEAGALRKPSAELFTALEEIADHGARVFGDAKAARKRKALAKARAKGKAPGMKGVVGIIETALRFVGAELHADYPTARARKKGEPTGYTLSWIWDKDLRMADSSWMETGIVDEFGKAEYYATPQPIPRHPLDVVSRAVEALHRGDAPSYDCSHVFE